jgi:hypothetical protein
MSGHSTSSSHLFSMVIFGVQKYLWGNLPAVGVLKLEQHEGVQDGQELNVMFAAKSCHCRVSRRWADSGIYQHPVT